ncbi:MAG: Rrf2 family transcriptional regulator [Nitrospirota bacterium]|nr:Rrf2 family transcriptional regulator [Nitrospirota bacterium]
MKLSTKGKYGVRALFEIARQYGQGPLSIKEISERQKISLSYLEQILHRLGKAGIIESVRGPHGGYVLARRPAEVTIGDVVRALEGPIALSHCLEPGFGSECYQADDCVARMVWTKVGEKIEEALDSISFEHLLQQYHGKDRELVPGKKRAVAGKGAC